MIPAIDAATLAGGEVTEGRRGPWMQTSSGGRFYPLDPRPEEILITDIANGHALDIRFGGQGRTDRPYSVGEHTIHLAKHALFHRRDAMLAWAMLFHDSPEGLIRDLPRAVKLIVADAYKPVEKAIERVIFAKVGLTEFMADPEMKALVKSLDERIIPTEKNAIYRYPQAQAWMHDALEPLEGVRIRCWGPTETKAIWAAMYYHLAGLLGFTTEEIEL